MVTYRSVAALIQGRENGAGKTSWKREQGSLPHWGPPSEECRGWASGASERQGGLGSPGWGQIKKLREREDVKTKEEIPSLGLSHLPRSP